MAQKTIRVNDPVHEHLEDKKAQYGAETFNEVLKRELGIIPGPNEIDKLVAYFAPELQEAVQEIVEVIREVDELHEHVEETEYGDDYKLVFTDPENGMNIAYIEFGDNRFDYYYRNTKREWEQAAAGDYRTRDDDLRFGDTGAGVYDHVELANVKDTVRQTVSGTLQRWRD